MKMYLYEHLTHENFIQKFPDLCIQPQTHMPETNVHVSVVLLDIT